MVFQTNPGHPATEPPAPAVHHVLTLTPFFPSLENEVNGCFIKEPLDFLTRLDITSSVIAVSPIHHPRRRPNPAAPATWVRYPQLPGYLGLPGAGRLLYARLLPVVSRLQRERPITLIHGHGALPCGRAAALLARRFQLPFVVTVHGLDVFNTGSLAGIRAKFLRQASIAVYQDAHTVVCVSSRVRQILHDGMPSGVRSAVVYNAVDTELFSPSVGGDSATDEILVVGNLIPTKGQELVLRAIGRMAYFPHLQCRIIGEGPDRTRLEALARKLGISHRIHLLGRQSRAAVADAMRRCSVFVLPSRSEGLGCVYLEAMSCAKPVIACRGQGIEEVIQHEKNGWLIPPNALDELVQALATLLRSDDIASLIGLAARQTILSRFTLSHQAKQLAAIYSEASTLGVRKP
jgi:teichuronic acid biosynthesis glycosyltransferase TuaC